MGGDARPSQGDRMMAAANATHARPVDEVIAAHYAANFGGNRTLEGLVVELALRSGLDVDRGDEPAIVPGALLVVVDKMLGTGNHPLALDAVNFGR